MASTLRTNQLNSPSGKVSVVNTSVFDNSDTNTEIKIPAGPTASEGFPTGRSIRYDTDSGYITIFSQNNQWIDTIDSFSPFANTRPGAGIIKDSLIFYIDSGNPVSYPGAGQIWSDLTGNYGVTLQPAVTYDPLEGSGSLFFSGSNNARGDLDEIITLEKETPWTLSWWYRPIMENGRWFRQNIVGSPSYSSPGFNLINEYFTPIGAGIAVDETNQKIYVAGRYTKFNGLTAQRVVRLNFDGTTDTSLNLGTGFTQGTSEYSYVFDVEVSSDGNTWYACGDFYTVNGVNAYRVAKMNYDGSLDAGFSQNSGGNSTVYSIALDETDPSGTPYLYCGGYSYRWRGQVANKLWKVDAITGDLEPTFNAGGGLTADGGNIGWPIRVLHLSISPDGEKILAVGDDFNEWRQTPISEGVVLVNRDGSLDTIFHGNLSVGMADNRVGLGCHIDANGKIYIGGNFEYLNNVTGLGVQRIARLNPDGTFDTSFLSDFRNGNVYTIDTVDIGGETKIYVSGSFTNVEGTTNERIIRLNYDGTKDTTFDNAIGLANRTELNGSAIDSLGRILLAGFFTSYKGNSQNYLTRINSDGSLDTSFNIGTAIEDGYFRLRWEHRYIEYTGSITAPAYWLGLGKVNNGTPRRFEQLAAEYDKQWINITATMTEDFYFRFFINGNNTANRDRTNQFNGAENINRAMDSGLIITKIGVRGTGTNVGDPFTGHISNIQLYNRVLSPDEVAQNYDAIKDRFGLE